MNFCLPPIQVKKNNNKKNPRKYSLMNLLFVFSQKQYPILRDGYIVFQTVFQIQSKIPDFQLAKDMPCFYQRARLQYMLKISLEGIQYIQSKEGR